MGENDLIYLDYANKLWSCPDCEVWVSFEDSQSCPVCNAEAPDPVFQWNAKQRDRRSKSVFKTQLKIGFYFAGLVLGVAAVSTLAVGLTATLPVGLGFLVWVGMLKIGGKKKK
jgi:hypothetical protein